MKDNNMYVKQTGRLIPTQKKTAEQLFRKTEYKNNTRSE